MCPESNKVGKVKRTKKWGNVCDHLQLIFNERKLDARAWRGRAAPKEGRARSENEQIEKSQQQQQLSK